MARSLRTGSHEGYLSGDTIAAISTGQGGAIHVLRVSGESAFQKCESLIRDKRKWSSLEPSRLLRFQIEKTNGTLIDDAMVVRFQNPASFTGEDVVEFHLHGSHFIAQTLMDCLAEQGVRQALPGEFSFRAVRNGKMTLAQAEAVADLIAVSNEGALALALEKLSGSQSAWLKDVSEGLKRLAAQGELGIDFSDQDVDGLGLNDVKKELQPLREKLDRLGESFDRGSRLQEGIKIALVGLPNAGKSSLFNALLGEDRAIVSDVAGTTRDVLREQMTLKSGNVSLTFRFEDTAGLRGTQDQVEAMGVERTHQAAQRADLILFVMDSSRAQEDLAAHQKIAQDLPASRVLKVWTKSDLNSPPEQMDILGSAPQAQASAVTPGGVKDLVDLLVQQGQKLVQRDKGEVLLTRQDQLQAVQDALEDIDRALACSDLELFASDIRHALGSLSPLIGGTAPDDILGKIFSEFCIGK